MYIKLAYLNLTDTAKMRSLRSWEIFQFIYLCVYTPTAKISENLYTTTSCENTLRLDFIDIKLIVSLTLGIGIADASNPDLI